MNDILNELITEIMSLGEVEKKPATKKRSDGRPLRAGESEDYPGYFHVTRNYYSNVKKGGQVTHKKEGDTMVPLTNQEKAKYRAKRAGRQPSDTPTPTSPQAPVGTPTQASPQQPSVDTQQTIGDLERRADNFGVKKKTVVQELLVAMKSGDPKKIQAVLVKYRIEIGDSGRLKARVLGKDKEGLADEQLSTKIATVLTNMGVEIKGGDTAGSKLFKPTTIFSNEPLDKLDVEETESGITVEGIEITRINENQAKVVENLIVKRARAALEQRGETLTPEYESRVRAYVQSRIRATNNNIRYLQEAARGGGGAYQFEGEEGGKKIADGLTGLVDQHLPEERKQAAKSAIDKMRTAKTPSEFNNAYNEFVTAVKGTAIDKNMKYVAETLTALRVVAFGGIALIPASDDYQLADVISLRKSPITGEIDIQLLLADVEEETEITAAGSVKVREGAASVNFGKIENSKFNTGEVDGVDCRDVQSDLSVLSDVGVKNTIFSGPPEEEEPTEEAKQMVMGYIQKYGPMVRAYFGFPEDMSDEDLLEALSYGRELECGPNGPQPPSDGKSFKEGQSGQPYSGKWRLWAALGQVTEAIHNRTVQEQYYHTVRYDKKGITVADGIRTLSKMKVQPVKRKTKRKSAEGRQVAFTIPVQPPDSINDGNPCNKKK